MQENSTRRVIQANRVMQVTWDWRSYTASDSAAAATAAAGLRRGAVIQALVMGLVGGMLYFGLHHLLFARVVWALAGLVLILGLAFPPAYSPIHSFGRRLAKVVGNALTYLLLVPFFYLFFTPVALILRVQGRDPLHRKFRDPQWTYWVGRSSKERDENIDKQFLREDKEARGHLHPVGTLRGPEGSDRS